MRVARTLFCLGNFKNSFEINNPKAGKLVLGKPISLDNSKWRLDRVP